MPSSSCVFNSNAAGNLCPSSAFLFFLFLLPFLVPFKHFDKFNPSCVDVFDAGRGKNCFLSPSLWRGVHRDKSDSLIEQPSGLLDYFAAVWLATDLWTADWLPFAAADKLIGCLLCLLDVNQIISLFVLSLAGEWLVTEWFLQWEVTGVVLFAVLLGHFPPWLTCDHKLGDWLLPRGRVWLMLHLKSFLHILIGVGRSFDPHTKYLTPSMDQMCFEFCSKQLLWVSSLY